jgi:hypothetical protein
MLPNHSDCKSPQTHVVYALTDRQLARSKRVSFSIISLISGTSFCSSGSDRAFEALASGSSHNRGALDVFENDQATLKTALHCVESAFCRLLRPFAHRRA